MSRVFYLFVCSCLLLTVCSEGPSIRFCEKWSDDINKMWHDSGNTIDYNRLEFAESHKYKFFVMLIEGKLSLGKINIRAIHLVDGHRESALLFPMFIENKDPQATLCALRIQNLTPESGDLYKYGIKPGHYYIFLEKNEKEIIGTELLVEYVPITKKDKEDDSTPCCLESYARDFIVMLVEKEFVNASKEFGDKMNKELPTDRLREMWTTIIINEVGAFKKILGFRQAKEQNYDIVYVTCQFTDAKIVIKVVYDKNRKVAGLWFLPK
ncbi:hypothetical protein ES705_34446 [subsurface metagenome]